MSTSAYNGKIAIVAGGASGIGEQIVRQLVSLGAKVIIIDRNESLGVALAATAPTVDFYKVDLLSVDLLRRFFRQVTKEHSRIDYFFNCAGTFLAGEIRDTPIEDWHRITKYNLEPIWNGTSVAYHVMLKQGFGHIINVASSAGLFPVPVMSIYGATKAAVVQFTLGLRMEAKGLGIQASVVCPTIVKTPLYDTAMYAGVHRKKALSLLTSNNMIQKPDKTAAQLLEKVSRNRAIIHTSKLTYLGWLLYRLSPGLYRAISGSFHMVYRKKFRIEG